MQEVVSRIIHYRAKRLKIAKMAVLKIYNERDNPGCEERSLNAVYREREDKLTKPEIVADGPVQEVVIKGINLYDLPIVTHNEKDAGPNITAGAMVVKDPEHVFII